MKNLFSITFLFFVALFLALPSFFKALTVEAITCSQLSNGVCGLNGATCSFEGGKTNSTYACTGSYPCCVFGPPTTSTPPPSGGGGGSGGGDAQYIGRVCYSPYTNGTCQYYNSYNCSGTWHTGGYCPGSSNVICCVPAPTATPTLTPTPTPAICPNTPTPIGSILSTGVAISASSVANNDNTTYGPANLVDGQLDDAHIWNSGQGPTGWVEINLGVPQTVTGLKLYVLQNPNGGTTTQIRTGQTPNPGTLQKTLSCLTSNNQELNINFPAALTNVQYIRITTTVSPSWVAWKEISVYGSSPGSQTTSPGIIFSGNTSATFGQGSASSTNWVVGGLTYPEVFNSERAVDSESGSVDKVKSLTSLTSYQLILDKAHTAQVTITDLSTYPTCNTLSNCTLPANLPNGVYQANGNLGLNTYAFLPNKNYVFLINGDLNVLGNIIVPNGSTAFFTSSHDIIIDKNVGTATNLFPLPAGQLQGIFSADRDFRIEGNNDCLVGKDKMLNIEGAIVTNALGNGGNFRSQRDLCGDNPRYPTLTIRARIDMLLNMPEILMQRTTTYREDAP